MIQENLFEEVLVKPVIEKDANKLFIVSGYATALMANRHLDFIKRINKNISVHIIVGMGIQDGIEKNNHYGFQQLQSNPDVFDFNCNYNITLPAVHSKTYAWYNDDQPICGFIGSANYTQNAFSGSIREILLETDPISCLNYYNNILGDSINCNEDSVESHIPLFDKLYLKNNPTVNSEILSSLNITAEGLDEIRVSLLDSRTNETPLRSGLNWGQRPGREPNQAYISIPSTIQQSGFFPERYNTFTILTDDERQLICARAQENGKAIHTTLNNSLMGEYFRNRLNLPNGSFVSKEHLLKYGRTDVTFYKIDDETYFMDFSVR